eukprot:1178246-Amphidinium_carterae.2
MPRWPVRWPVRWVSYSGCGTEVAESAKCSASWSVLPVLTLFSFAFGRKHKVGLHCEQESVVADNQIGLSGKY